MGKGWDGVAPPSMPFQVVKTIQYDAEKYVDPEFLDGLKDEWHKIPLCYKDQEPPILPQWMTLSPQPHLVDWKDIINDVYLKDHHPRCDEGSWNAVVRFQ